MRRSVACLATGLTVYGAAAVAQIPAGSLYVDVSGEAVTVHADSVSVREVLEELAHQSGLKMVLLAPLDAPLTVTFERRPLPDAIRSILRRHNFALQYAQAMSGSGPHARLHPGTLWVFPDAGTSVPQRDGNHVVTLDEATGYPGATGGPVSIEQLESALMDPDSDARETAIETLAGIGGDAAAQALAPALDDTDVGVRVDAVDALGEIGGATATALLQQALLDESAEIREIAAGYLQRLSQPGP